MDDSLPPPPYEQSTFADDKRDPKQPHRFRIREEVHASQAQHVSAIVNRLLPRVEDRARSGLCRTDVILLPSDQESCRQGVLVGVSDDQIPDIIQLEGAQESLAFWSQPQVIDGLHKQLLGALADDNALVEKRPAFESPPAALPTAPSSSSRSRWFGRKNDKTEVMANIAAENIAPATNKSMVSASVQLEEVSFRAESEFGLYETRRGKGVVIAIEVH